MQKMTGFGKLICLIFALGSAIQSAWSADDVATRQLVDQARYWQQNAREDLAAGAWRKLLRADSSHPEALIRLGLIEARAGRVVEAQELYRRAAQLSSAPAGLADLESALKAGKNAPAIDTARKQAQTGQAEAAASSYRSALGTSKPTGQLGLEYYQTLGATRDGWEEGRRGLEELARNNPGNQRYLLALARHLTYRESGRREGIRQLAVLSQRDQADQEVQKSLRQALVWLNARRTDRALFTAYLSRYPEDPEIQKRLTLLDRPAPAARKSAQVSPNQLAFNLLAEGQIEAAAARFQAILAKHPRDADALGGLGTIRLRQQAFGEAVDLLDQAMKIDGRHAARWQQARDSARYWTLLQPVLKARQAGKLLDVEDKLLEATRLDDKQILGQVLLGDLWLEKRQLPKAESVYRAALKTTDFDPGAFRGLITVLMQTGREREALSMISTLDEAAALKVGGVNQLKAAAMLKLAQADERAADYRAASEKLESALSLDPTSPWLGLALARQYQRLGDVSRASAMLDTVLRANPDLAEALHARALLYAEQKLWPDAVNSLERIPVAARTEKIAEDQRRFSVNLQLQRAQRLFAQGNRLSAEAALRQAESGAGQDPSLLALIAASWSKDGQAGEAYRLMREVVKRAPIQDVGVRIQYAGTLLDTGQDVELSNELRVLAESPRLTTAQQEDLNGVIIAHTLRQADALRQAGRLAQAYGTVRPALEQTDDPRLLMALARIYNTAGEQQKALALAERVIAREPNDLDHRLFASGVALGAKAVERAVAQAEAALKIAPANPRALAAAGRAEKERGNSDKSLAYFEKAQAIERTKLASSAVPVAPLARSQTADSAWRALPLPSSGLKSDGQRELGYLAPLSGFTSEPKEQRAGLLPIPGDFTEVPTRDSSTPAPQLALVASTWAQTVASTLKSGSEQRDATGRAPLTQPAEPLLMTQIDAGERTMGEEIDAIKLKLTTVIDVGAGWRSRSGEPGLGRLNQVEIPIEMTLPTSHSGTFVLRLTPTLLSPGALNGFDPATTAKFGSAAMGPLVNGLNLVPEQNASGVAVSVGYRNENLALNLGTTPLGFLVSNVVGGLSFSSQLDQVTLRGALNRRAVTDSKLAFAGMRDPRTQVIWGGVVKSGGQVGLTYGGDAGGVYADLGGATLSGQGVKDNAELEAGLGAYWRVYQTAQSKLTLGLRLTTLAYRDNLGYFTLGHGGYFSPRQYFSLGVPWDLAGRRGGFSYQVGGELSVQKFSQDRAAYFPNDANLQSAWAAKAAATYATYYEAESSSGLGYKLYGSFEYPLTPRFVLGGRMAFDNSRNYAQQTGMLYLRYAFDGFPQPITFPPRALMPPIP